MLLTSSPPCPRPGEQDKLIRYREGNTKIVAEHGGSFVARGGSQQLLEGDWDPLRIVIIEFPDMDAARGWYHSDGYAPLRELRRGASVTDIVLVEGVYALSAGGLASSLSRAIGWLVAEAAVSAVWL